ncbi:hypothetical protein Hanom_Chr03g00234231 [Helianthus anomalus]
MGARKDLAKLVSCLTQEECYHFEFSNLRHPFSNFVLNILEYYCVSLGQIHPQGLARVMYFEVLCRASGYDPTLLSFRRFF